MELLLCAHERARVCVYVCRREREMIAFTRGGVGDGRLCFILSKVADTLSVAFFFPKFFIVVDHQHLTRQRLIYRISWRLISVISIRLTKHSVILSLLKTTN